jgi:Uma2 family endonuclease
MALPDLTRKLTYEDYVLIPEDGLRHEILDGEHYVSPAPFTRHQFVSGRLYLYLGIFLAENDLGSVLYAPTDVVLSSHDIAQPDLLFVSKARLAIITEKNVQGPPDLVVEILSESNRHVDERVKLDRYGRLGVGEYWILDPKRKTARIFRREKGRLILLADLSDPGDHLASPLLPGLEIPLAGIFA